MRTFIKIPFFIISVLVVGLVFLALFVSGAFAHHPTVSGKVECLKINQTWFQKVTWTVANSETASNRDMTIFDLSRNLIGLDEGDVVQNSDSETGVEFLNNSVTGTITLSVTGQWKYANPDIFDTKSGSVNLTGTCGVTPTPTLTPVPSQPPCESCDCEGGDTYSVRQDCPPEETPTPTPTVVPCTHDCEPTFAGSSTNPPAVPTCSEQLDAPKLQGFVDNLDGTHTYSWWGSTTPGISKQSVVYGFQPGDERFGLDNLGTGETTVTFPWPFEATSWLQVWSFKNGCVAKSEWFN